MNEQGLYLDDIIKQLELFKKQYGNCLIFHIDDAFVIMDSTSGRLYKRIFKDDVPTFETSDKDFYGV